MIGTTSASAFADQLLGNSSSIVGTGVDAILTTTGPVDVLVTIHLEAHRNNPKANDGVGALVVYARAGVAISSIATSLGANDYDSVVDYSQIWSLNGSYDFGADASVSVNSVAPVLPSNSSASYSVTFSAVPEPSSLTLMLVAVFIGCAFGAKRLCPISPRRRESKSVPLAHTFFPGF
jgi:hypothetical protein